MKINCFEDWWKIVEGDRLTADRKSIALAAWDACVNNYPEMGGAEQSPRLMHGSTGDEVEAGKGQQDGVGDSLNQLIVYHAEQEFDRAKVKDYEKAAEHRNKRIALENFKDLYFNAG